MKVKISVIHTDGKCSESILDEDILGTTDFWLRLDDKIGELLDEDVKQINVMKVAER